MKPATKLPAALVASIVRADGSQLYWRERSDDLFADEAQRMLWNKRYAGSAVRVRPLARGYLSFRIHHHALLVHRTIWMLAHGAWPDELDHINGDVTDNRLENLRNGSKADNMRNQYVRSDSSSGFPGVHFCRDKKKKPWVARIGVAGRWKTLGYFATREEAIACRKSRQPEFRFSVRHGAIRGSEAA